MNFRSTTVVTLIFACLLLSSITENSWASEKVELVRICKQSRYVDYSLENKDVFYVVGFPGNGYLKPLVVTHYGPRSRVLMNLRSNPGDLTYVTAVTTVTAKGQSSFVKYEYGSSTNSSFELRVNGEPSSTDSFEYRSEVDENFASTTSQVRLEPPFYLATLIRAQNPRGKTVQSIPMVCSKTTGEIEYDDDKADL